MAPETCSTTSESSGTRHADILVVAADSRVLQRLCSLLGDQTREMHFDIRTANTLAAIRQTAADWRPDAVLLDPRLPDIAETEAVCAVRSTFPDAAVIVLLPPSDCEFTIRIVSAQDDAIMTLGEDLADTILPSLQQALAMRHARRCCEQLGKRVEALRDQLARNQAALAEESEQRSRLEAMFQTHRTDYLAILDSAPAMIWYIDRNGTILRANKRAAECVGMPVSDVVGANYYTLYGWQHQITPDEDHAIMESNCPRCGMIVHTEMQTGWRWLRIDRIPWTDCDGAVTGITIFATDITEAKAAEEQLVAAKEQIERTNAQLRAAAREAQTYADQAIAANRIKSRFLASVTHELRTPMNAIIGYSDLLAEEQLSREQKQYLSIIQRSAQNLLALIDDVLDFSKIEAGKLDVCIRQCDPRRVLVEVYDLMKQTAHAKGLAFVLSASDLPAVITTDPGRLRQCLMNLVGNALKFTDTGRVTIQTALAGEGADAMLRIDVCDTGIGIPKDKQQYIFECFVQADTCVSAARGGTGLGLSITKRLMELLGGAVEFTSQPGKGSTFSLLLPVHGPRSPVTDIESAANGTNSTAENSENGRYFSGTVLLAESEPANRLLTYLMLTRAGLRVDEVADACSAVQKACQTTHDLVLLDTALPPPGANEVVRQLRSAGLKMPILTLSTDGTPNGHEASLRAGFDGRLVKPFTRKDLYDLLAKFLPTKTKQKQN
ncbi:MAG TPA: ATP-binding protein [Anaerohalosphaeraceae bacterium]|jgi:PAS domain S-box-containing protein|nr:ATP-binding protein [Anaerohalosphaeraceae bacterium]HRT51710.1 ATP-binding protein [Anaerohalosphaeraceae bacterium]HRT87712.1 ATP-binding protein [Anaerohalosphaeraceae bacterium]